MVSEVVDYCATIERYQAYDRDYTLNVRILPVNLPHQFLRALRKKGIRHNGFKICIVLPPTKSCPSVPARKISLKKLGAPGTGIPNHYNLLMGYLVSILQVNTIYHFILPFDDKDLPLSPMRELSILTYHEKWMWL